MDKFRASLIFQCLIFLIPLNIYMWGNWMLLNLQWALFRFQESEYGSSLILGYKDVLYIFYGLNTGIFNIAAALLWTIGTIILIIGLLLTLLACKNENISFLKQSSFFTFGGGIILGISAACRFHGGFAIPIGIPIILIIGWWIYHTSSIETSLVPDSEATFKVEDFRIFDETFHGLPNTRVQNDILILVVFSIIVKLVIVFFTTNILHSFIDNYDISIYYTYAISTMSGQIPYVNFNLEYPQFAIIPMLISAIPLFFWQSYSVYALTFQSLMTLCDIITLTLLYLIALKLYGRENAFLCGLLYLTAFSTAYFVITKYDAVPTLIVILSLFLFIYKNEMQSVVFASVGSLFKWFSVLTIPFYIIFTIKNNGDSGKIIKGLVISFFVILLVIIPFILLNLQGFISTYSVHIFRPAEAHSLIYYLDSIAQSLLNISPFSQMAIVVLLIIQILLFYWYYAYARKSYLTLCYAIFFSMFAFILLNKVFSPQYIVWITPFLALFLFHSYEEIALFFSIQLVFYLEHPILYGIVYTPSKTYAIIENSLPTTAFGFFTIKFVLLLILFIVLIRQMALIDNDDIKKIEYEIKTE